MPIAIAPTGRPVRVVRVAADGKTRRHLENLGITVESEIEVISRSGGSVICKLKSGRLALDGNLAARIFVA